MNQIQKRNPEPESTHTFYGEPALRFRFKALVICVAAILGSPESAVSASAGMKQKWAQQRSDHKFYGPSQAVANCNASGPGSLREAVALAQSGSTVDLTQLSCSVITLTTGGEIVVSQDYLRILGPGRATLSVSGNHASRVFKHTGAGTLNVEALTIANGLRHTTGMEGASGGCIYSLANVYLKKAVVADCAAIADNSEARGAGVYATNNTTLILSTISGNHANSPYRVSGGGITTGNLFAWYSTISNNSADPLSPVAMGGGALAWSSTTLLASTVDNNQAERIGGIASGVDAYAAGAIYIENSTISRNTADHIPALGTSWATGTTILNTTIAFNHATNTASSGAVFIANYNTELQSSIIANNTAGGSNVASDLYLQFGTLTGARNLVIATNKSPPGVITVTSDPKLGPLQYNGGPTRTNALLRGSPAISNGNNSSFAMNDQRGRGYPRMTGPNETTDIGSFQFDSIFAGPFD